MYSTVQAQHRISNHVECGKVCKSSTGLAAHRSLAHGVRNPAVWYASQDGMCACCGLVFADRQLLMAHLTRGSRLCFLNVVLTLEPFSRMEEDEHRDAARKQAIANKKSGDTRHKAVCPAYRVPWACCRLYDLEGRHVPHCGTRHPWTTGPGKLNYGCKDA